MLLSRFSSDPEDKIRALSGGDEKQAATHSPRGFLTQVHTKHTPGQ